MYFLGHIVSAAGIEPDLSKIEKIKDYPVPNDVTSLRRSLRLASYYRHFVPKFAAVAAPLHRLTKKKVHFKRLQVSFSEVEGRSDNRPSINIPSVWHKL